MPMLLALAMFVLLLGQQPATTWLLGQTDFITILSEALFNLGPLSLVVAGIGSLAFGTGLVAYQLFRTSFYEGWDRFQ